jgi:hypothetical protein
MKALILFVFSFLYIAVFHSTIYPQDTIFVWQSAMGANNGTSWSNAYTGFDKFNINNTDTVPNGSIILVREGIYSEGHSSYVHDSQKSIIWIKKNRGLKLIAVPNPNEEVVLDGGDSTHLGIELYTQAITDAVTNILIDNFIIKNFVDNGIKIRGIPGSPRVYVDTVTIRNCLIFDNKAEGVKVQTARNISIYDNEITFTGNSGTETDGIFINEYGEDIVIERNKIIINNSTTATSPHIDAIQIAAKDSITTMANKNIIIRNNFLRNYGIINNYANRAGIMVTGIHGYLSIYNNTIIGRGNNLIRVTYYDSTNSIGIYNNTLVGLEGQQHLLSVKRESGGISSLKILNNIFHQAGIGSLSVNLKFESPLTADSLTNTILNHNLYYNVNGTPKIEFTTNVNWNSDSTKFEQKGVGGHPNFSDTSEYKLAYRSPAKNKGKNLINAGITTDRFNNPRPYWNANDFDIGAFEINDAQFKIGVIGVNESDSITHTIKAYGSYWERNGTERFTLSSDNSLSNTSITTVDNSSDTIDYWRGWTFNWLYPSVPDSNQKFGHGLYKLSNNHSSSVLYIDARDAIEDYSPNVYIRYDAEENLYHYFNGTIFIALNPTDTLLRIWQIKNEDFATDNLQDYKDHALVSLSKNNRPWLVWGPMFSVPEHLLWRNFDENGWVELDWLIDEYEYLDTLLIVTGEEPTTVLVEYKVEVETRETNEVYYYVHCCQQPKINSFADAPNLYSLSQNYPNPFNPSTTISFSIASDENVSLKLYDILGREVASLFNEKLRAGAYEMRFNLSYLSSGIYFYRIAAGKFSEIKKLQLLK